MGFSGYTSCKKSHYYDRRPIALSSSNARFSLPFGPVFANAGVCGGGMAGEDRFPPHLSPFAKVITEVGSGAKRQLGLRALDDADHRDVLGQGQIAGTA